MEAFVDEVANLVRSQSASIFGNVFVGLPRGLRCSGCCSLATHEIPVDADKAAKTIDSLSILGPSAFFAAFTGVLLWFSSVLAGWVDNWFHYRRLGPAIAGAPAARLRLRPLDACSAWPASSTARSRASPPTSRWASCSGSVPVFFAFYGLPVEVRHVTLSSGQLAATVVVLGWGVATTASFWLAVAGIALIGVLNVGVSFALALQRGDPARATSSGVRRARGLRRHPAPHGARTRLLPLPRKA